MLWAAPKIDPETAGEGAAEDPPLETIDIPDPIDPPSGCRFHTRCPEARDACKHQSPALYDAKGGDHEVVCFRQVDDHVYWRTEEIHD